jgi:hypothetical protein
VLPIVFTVLLIYQISNLLPYKTFTNVIEISL